MVSVFKPFTAPYVFFQSFYFQIMLWEGERNRFTFTDGVLYNQFLSVADFETVRSYADQLGVLVWANPQKRTVVVTKEGHDPVKKFWKQQQRA